MDAAGMAAYFSYADAPAALAWFETLGFEVKARQDDDSGGIAHAELRHGDVVVMVSSFDDDYETAPLRGHSVGHGVYVRTDDVDSWYAKAIDAGATTVLAPHDTEWGTRRARILDPGGYEWSFGSYQPADPAGWA